MLTTAQAATKAVDRRVKVDDSTAVRLNNGISGDARDDYREGSPRPAKRSRPCSRSAG